MNMPVSPFKIRSKRTPLPLEGSGGPFLAADCLKTPIDNSPAQGIGLGCVGIRTSVALSCLLQILAIELRYRRLGAGNRRSLKIGKNHPLYENGVKVTQETRRIHTSLPESSCHGHMHDGNPPFDRLRLNGWLELCI
jgi:hypothetical protein